MTNYFDFFNIPVRFNIDFKTLRSRYIANSKLYHPDYHTLSSEDTQDNVLEQSTINNKGWKVLSDDRQRITHVLEIHNAWPAEGEATVPQEFLMDMMDINEVLMDLEMDPNADQQKKLISSIHQLEENLSQEGQVAMDAWDHDQQEDHLVVIKDYQLKMKYLQRIKDKIK